MSNIGLIVAKTREIPDILQHKKLGIHKIGNDDVYIVVSGIGPKKPAMQRRKFAATVANFILIP